MELVKTEISKCEYWALVGLFSLAASQYSIISNCENEAHNIIGEEKNDVGARAGEALFDYAITPAGTPLNAVKRLLKIKGIEVK